MAYSNPHRFLEMPPLDDKVSVLSDGAAVLYRSADLEIPLTPAELYELVCYNLKPEQVMMLKTHFGVFFEIHDDFYDVQTLEALQPLHKR